MIFRIIPLQFRKYKSYVGGALTREEQNEKNKLKLKVAFAEVKNRLFKLLIREIFNHIAYVNVSFSL